MKPNRKTKKAAPSKLSIPRFQNIVLTYHKEHGRNNLPWRKTHDPYKIMVSEIMLQQTQVPRVIEKYKMFLKAFPTVRKLADAPLREVVRQWSGLGYNRRAKFLHEAAKKVMKEYRGKMPKTAEELKQLPGIGPYTAGAIAAFAYNTPGVFIETNIRSVFIHHFFPSSDSVNDKELLSLIEKTATGQHSQEWYAALMDYGSFLKETEGNVSKRSAHYTKQSKFRGSLRETRGEILRALRDKDRTTRSLAQHLCVPEHLREALTGLEKDGLICRMKDKKGVWTMC